MKWRTLLYCSRDLSSSEANRCKSVSNTALHILTLHEREPALSKLSYHTVEEGNHSEVIADADGTLHRLPLSNLNLQLTHVWRRCPQRHSRTATTTSTTGGG